MNDILCTKCNISKDLSGFDTEINNKTAHLDICAQCFLKDYDPNDLYKTCVKCDKYMQIDKFSETKKGFDSYCRPCRKEYKRQYDAQHRQQHYDYIKRNGYSKYRHETYVKNKPYFSEYKKKKNAETKKILDFVKAHPELQEIINKGDSVDAK